MSRFYFADPYVTNLIEWTDYDPFQSAELSMFDGFCDLSGSYREDTRLIPDICEYAESGSIDFILYENNDSYNSTEVSLWQLGALDPFDPPVDRVRFLELCRRGFMNVLRNTGGVHMWS